MISRTIMFLRTLDAILLPMVVFFDLRHRMKRLTMFGPEYTVWKLTFQDRWKFARSTFYQNISHWYRKRRAARRRRLWKE